MVASFATLSRQASIVRRQIHEIRQARDLAALPSRSAVEVAADLGITLDPWQERALGTEAKEIMLLASRQAGKSTTAGILATHEAVYVPGSLTLIVSPAERQSKRVLRSVRRHYAHFRTIAPPVSEGILSIELRNGSEIHALPGSEETIRGFSAVDLLIVDEGARVPDELYNAVRPMLAVSNGRLVTMSTSFGRRGWFYDEWEHGKGWHREKVTADQISRIDPAWLAREKERIGEWWFRQEYMCEFLEATGMLFTLDDIAAAFDEIEDDYQPRYGMRAFG